MANASIYVSRVSSSCFLLLWEALQDQQVGLTQAPFKCPAAAKLLQSCPTLCDPIDGSPPGSTIPGILQARTLEWVAISFSNAWKWKVKVKSLSCVQLSATPWTAVYQAPLSMGFSREEYWNGVPLPSPFKRPGECEFSMRPLRVKSLFPTALWLSPK